MSRLFSFLFVITLVTSFPIPAGGQGSCILLSGDELILGQLGQGYGVYSVKGCPIKVK